MSKDNNEQSNESFLAKLGAEDILATIDGIPLPPSIKKSLWKSIGRLITGIVDVPVAMLEAKVQKIKSEANALSLVTKTASVAAAKEFGEDQYLIDRTVNHFGSKLLREQINRETIVEKAAEELGSDPPKEDSKDVIDDDWLEMFSRIAETKSNEDMQLFLARILAGEIRKPGTFGAKTVQTLSFLDQTTAKVFQSFCNVSFEIPQLGDGYTCVVSEPFGNAGNNGMSSLGLSYPELARLQDAGLLQYELSAWRPFHPAMFHLGVKLGATNLAFGVPIDKMATEPQQVKVLNFTAVGLELRKVLHVESNQAYIDKFNEWVIGKWGFAKI